MKRKSLAQEVIRSISHDFEQTSGLNGRASRCMWSIWLHKKCTNFCAACTEVTTTAVHVQRTQLITVQAYILDILLPRCLLLLLLLLCTDAADHSLTHPTGQPGMHAVKRSRRQCSSSGRWASSRDTTHSRRRGERMLTNLIDFTFVSCLSTTQVVEIEHAQVPARTVDLGGPIGEGLKCTVFCRERERKREKTIELSWWLVASQLSTAIALLGIRFGSI
jgi:hypothetical protein